MTKVAAAGSVLAAVTLIASCSASGSPGSSSPAASSPGATTSSSNASPTVSKTKTFTSATYGYTVKLPAGWFTIQALEQWDGHSNLTFDASAEVDHFGSGSAAVLAAAAQWKRDLAAYARFWIVFTARYHGEFCPPKPNTRNPVTIGGQPGLLLGYNCGILINHAVTVHNGVGYVFSFRDETVDAATDPTDHATFVNILKSVQFPD